MNDTNDDLGDIVRSNAEIKPTSLFAGPDPFVAFFRRLLSNERMIFVRKVDALVKSRITLKLLPAQNTIFGWGFLEKA